jgi:type VI protein secretion system component VasF
MKWSSNLVCLFREKTAGESLYRIIGELARETDVFSALKNTQGNE